MSKTFSEKILASKSGRLEVVPGQIVIVKPDHLLTHDNTAAIISKIEADLNEFGIVNPDLPVIVLDHVIPAASEKTALNHKIIRNFVSKYSIPHFFDIGNGICHQIFIEKGFALPSTIVTGSDSHTCSYGALNVFSTGIDRTEAASILLSGETWFRVPESIKITLKGKLNPSVSAKDLILTIIGNLGADGANYCAVEFHGDIENISIEERFTIANMGVEMGAKITVFPFDDITKEYLSSINVDHNKYNPIWADKDANYQKEISFNLCEIEPVIALPHSVDNVKPIRNTNPITFDQFFIGTCTNGRIDDLKIAARILDGRKIARGCRLLILPASKTILESAISKGFISKLLKAGAIILPPGCGPCLGAHQGCLAPGEKCLSTANRNFKGRMGSKEAEIYLASPETVAKSAIEGRLINIQKEIAK